MSYEKNGVASSDKSSDLALELDTRRRAALSEIDNAKFNWFHVKTVLVAGVGFFTDAYDIFAINIASTIIGYVYNQGVHKGALTANQDLGLKIATPVGTLVGQLLFGYLADHVGRKRMYGIELIIILVATLGQAVAGHGPGVSIIGVLVMWRFIMGVGIGGDYPLSAIITSEFAATRIRGRMMTAVFAMQGFGNLAAALVALIVVSAYKGKIINTDTAPYNLNHVDACWRFLLGLGCVPAACALYFRLTIPETPRYSMDIDRDLKAATADIDATHKNSNVAIKKDLHNVQVAAPKASWADFRRHFGQWKNGKVLLGTAWSWFALDVAFYGLGLNSSIILQAIGFGSVTAGASPTTIIYQNIRNVSIGNIILACAGLIPGYWVSFIFIDKWGRKPIQLMGFTMLTILFVILGFAYYPLKNNSVAAFVVIYCLINFFQNFGPNTTTFVVPGEVFPTRYRSTAHGMSAASGKFGAIIAQVMAFKLKDRGGKNMWINHILEIFALFMLTGIFSTLLIPETKGKTLEQLSNEDQDGFIQTSHRDDLHEA